MLAPIHNVLKILDITAVEKVLTQWVNNIVESRPDLKGCLDAVLSVFRFTEATRIADMMKYYASNPKLVVNIIK